MCPVRYSLDNTADVQYTHARKHFYSGYQHVLILPVCHTRKSCHLQNWCGDAVTFTLGIHHMLSAADNISYGMESTICPTFPICRQHLRPNPQGDKWMDNQCGTPRPCCLGCCMQQHNRAPSLQCLCMWGRLQWHTVSRLHNNSRRGYRLAKHTAVFGSHWLRVQVSGAGPCCTEMQVPWAAPMAAPTLQVVHPSTCGRAEV
jgi:hypothetical protein